MKTNHPHPDDTKLSSLLRDARTAPPRPPRFQENVWRRIANSDASAKNTAGWLETILALILRPRLAFATVAALVVVGALIGAHDGTQRAQQEAQARYLASVAPNSLH